MSLPATYNLDLYRGDDWELPLEFAQPDGSPVDLTGYTVVSQIRKYRVSEEALVNLSVSIPDPSNGAVFLSLSSDQIRALPETCVWDLELQAPGPITKTWLEGAVHVFDDVTRSV